MPLPLCGPGRFSCVKVIESDISWDITALSESRSYVSVRLMMPRSKSLNTSNRISSLFVKEAILSVAALILVNVLKH